MKEKSLTQQLKELGLSPKGIKSVLNHIYYIEGTIRYSKVIDVTTDIHSIRWVIFSTPYTKKYGEVRSFKLEDYLSK